MAARRMYSPKRATTMQLTVKRTSAIAAPGSSIEKTYTYAAAPADNAVAKTPGQKPPHHAAIMTAG